jgi:acyl transferase domain-containing protein/acyl carrier protein
VSVSTDLSVAVVGLACRFPGARTPEEFFAHLLAGRSCLSRFGPDELEERADHPRYVPVRGILGDAEQFDPAFFGYSPREAEILDPQHRIALEVCWEALESAGHTRSAARERCGVFYSANVSTWLLRYLLPAEESLRALGPALIHQSNVPDQVAARVAYRFGLVGPVMAVQTACSSSLVAVHLAVQALLTGECDLALAGGVSIVMPERTGYVWQPGGLLSADGEVHALDAAASGTVFSNGAGAVLLKRLSDALADGDPIHAVVRGTAVGNDGSGKVGFAAPGADGQVRVIRAALQLAGLEPSELGFVETHGTGTELGDPIELASLGRVFSADPAAGSQRCLLGSVKPNIGHLDNAAGIAGFLKVVLAVRDGVVPGTRGYRSDSPHAPLAGTPLRVSAQPEPFPAGRVRRAGVSAFGVGGTNAHAIVEEPPQVQRALVCGPELLVVSAPSEAQLAGLVQALGSSDASLADMARTLAGRPLHRVRRAAAGQDRASTLAALQGAPSRTAPAEAVRAAFLFPGQGRLDPGALAALQARFPALAETFARCSQAAGADLTRSDGPVALLALEIGLARLWMGLGVQPAFVMGHSLGEYAAAVIAGIWSEEDAVRIVVRRSQLVEETGEGAMLAVAVGEEGWASLARPGDEVELAAINGPEQVVLSGRPAAIAAVEQRLVEARVATVRLGVRRALHSAALDPILGPFGEVVAARPPSPPQIPMISGRTGAFASGAELVSVEHWVRQLREPVRFDRALQAAPAALLLELGPAAGLGNPLASLPRGVDAPAGVLAAVGRAVQAGLELDLERLCSRGARRVPLAVLPLARTRCTVARLAPPSLRAPAWVRGPQLGPPSSSRRSVVVLTRGGPLGEAVVAELRAAGHTVTTLRPGPEYQRASRHEYLCDLASADHLLQLLAELRLLALTPSHVLHLLGAEPGGEPYAPLLEPAALVRALDVSGRATEVSVLFVVAGAHDVLGSEALAPEKAMTGAVARVAQQEIRALRCRTVDLERDLGAAPAPALVRELDATEPEVALRGSARWVRHDLPVAAPPPPVSGGNRIDEHASGSPATPRPGERCESVRFSERTMGIVSGGNRIDEHASGSPATPRPGERCESVRFSERTIVVVSGTVLVTGGTGGVGLALAEALVGAGAQGLVLVARRASLAAGDPRIEALQARAAVELVDADVADRQDMACAVERARRGPGGLQGAVHAAGVAGGRLLATSDPTSLADVLRPKLDGARILLELLEPDPVRFVSLCGSSASWFGGIGQGAYAAANAALAALALQARRRGQPVTSVAWDTWRGVGMASGQSGELVRLGLAPSEGQALFLASLGTPHAELLASRIPVGERASRASALRLESLKPAAAEPSRSEPRDEPLHNEPPRNEIEQAVASVFHEVLGVEVTSAHADFFELGGQSLLASQAVGRLRDLFDIDLPALALFEGRTVAEVALRIEEALLETPETLL